MCFIGFYGVVLSHELDTGPVELFPQMPDVFPNPKSSKTREDPQDGAAPSEILESCQVAPSARNVMKIGQS